MLLGEFPGQEVLICIARVKGQSINITSKKVLPFYGIQLDLVSLFFFFSERIHTHCLMF